MFGNLWERLVTRLLDFYSAREPLRAFGYPIAGFLLCSGTFESVWLPGCWKLPVFGNLWERLVTQLMEITCVREPLRAFGYPVDGNYLCSGTFESVWLPSCWKFPVFGNLWERLVTRSLDFYSEREPLRAFSYPVSGNFLYSGTIESVWLPDC